MTEGKLLKIAIVISASVHILGFGGMNLARPLFHVHKQSPNTKVVYYELAQEVLTERPDFLRTRRLQYLEEKDLKFLPRSLPNSIGVKEFSPTAEKEKFSSNNISLAKNKPIILKLETKGSLSKKEEGAYNSYYEVLREKIRRELEKSFKKPFQEGEVRISFIISQTGELAGAWVNNSSGIKALDEIALRSVEKAAPFYPLPKGFAEENARFNVIISFEIEGQDERKVL